MVWIGRSMYSRQQFTDLTYMGGTGPLWTDEDNFWWCYLELVYKPKHQIWCNSDVPCAQSSSLPIWPIWEVPYPVDRYSPFSIPTSAWVIEAYVCSSLCSDVIVFTTDGRTDGWTDRHSSNVLEFCADQMSPRNIGSQIIISRCYKRIDKTNIPSLRRV